MTSLYRHDNKILVRDLDGLGPKLAISDSCCCGGAEAAWACVRVEIFSDSYDEEPPGNCEGTKQIEDTQCHLCSDGMISFQESLTGIDIFLECTLDATICECKLYEFIKLKECVRATVLSVHASEPDCETACEEWV